jgi:hypothetical protein
MVAIPILGRVMPLELGHFKEFYSFPDFFSAMCTAIALKPCTWLYINDLQIKFNLKMIAVNYFF